MGTLRRPPSFVEENASRRLRALLETAPDLLWNVLDRQKVANRFAAASSGHRLPTEELPYAGELSQAEVVVEWLRQRQ